MDRVTAEHRDRVLRAFFEGKDWDTNPEFLLKRHVVRRSLELLPAFPLLVDDEWEAVSGQSNKGRGDLVFTDGAGGFAVIEVKHIDLARTGKTVRTGRNRRRGEVAVQALNYAVCIQMRHGCDRAVGAFVYTNERPAELIDARSA
jgi:hypothetical protein